MLFIFSYNGIFDCVLIPSGGDLAPSLGETENFFADQDFYI